MKNTFLSARLIEANLIRLAIFSSVPFEGVEATLLVDEKKRVKLIPNKVVSLSSQVLLDYRFEEPLILGHSYLIVIPSYGTIPLDVTEATSFSDFDKDFYYDGDDLGATYSKDKTSFALWAPISSEVILEIRKEKEKKPSFYPMKRGERGVYRLSLKGDYERAEYLYHVKNNEVFVSSIDPYAKCSSPNGSRSVVASFSRLMVPLYRENLPAMNSYCDAIIYEGHVRDLTIDPSTNIEHKGKFLGLIEEGRKTQKGNPAGFDYLLSLGFTHLQLQPLQDYATVDELHPEKEYNWGYDPSQYFVPEGSFASNVLDPYSRIKECRMMIGAFHKAHLRVVLDVVYNHVYEYQFSSLEKIVPNYFFRRRSNGKIANTSGCGNDIASERPMAKKLIVDSAKWWIDFYGVDGFRFDLSGIITVKTVQEIIAYGKKKDPYFIAYGEGWNMGGEVNEPLLTMENHSLAKEYAFFNDKYREAVKRYSSGDLSAISQAKFVIAGSSVDFCGNQKMFSSASQSLNYVECHDNATYFDFLSKVLPDASLTKKLLLCKFALSIVLSSIGIPFIHAGEEVGQSKWMNENTYNSPDWYNRLSYKLIDERMTMVEHLRSLIAFRKKTRFLHAYDPELLDRFLDVNNDGDLLLVSILGEENASPYKEIHFFYNPTDVKCVHKLTSREVALFGKIDSLIATKGCSVIVPPHEFIATALPE